MSEESLFADDADEHAAAAAEELSQISAMVDQAKALQKSVGVAACKYFLQHIDVFYENGFLTHSELPSIHPFSTPSHAGDG